MNKTNTVDTAKKGQTTTKNNIPTGKIKTLKSQEERRKAREENYANFRISALKRRCKRYGFDEAKTNEYIEKLKAQMSEPKQYSILIMLSDCKGVTEKSKSNDSEGLFKSPATMLKEAFKEAGIKYNVCCESHCMLTGDQKILAKIREIAPDGAKIYPYAKKMECVIPEDERKAVKVKKPSNNTAEKKAINKAAKKIFRGTKGIKHRQAGRYKTIADIRKAARYVKKNLKKGEKLDVNKVKKVVEERAKGGAATTVQLKANKRSKGSKKASMNLKKAA